MKERKQKNTQSVRCFKRETGRTARPADGDRFQIRKGFKKSDMPNEVPSAAGRAFFLIPPRRRRKTPEPMRRTAAFSKENRRLHGRQTAEQMGEPQEKGGIHAAREKAGKIQPPGGAAYCCASACIWRKALALASASRRSCLRRILPEVVLGSSSTNSTMRGYL